jgi:hypothetical protein
MPSFNLLISPLRLGLLLGLLVLAGPPEHCRAQARTTTTPAQAVAAGKTYAGTIGGKYAITMRLRRDGAALTGSYAYTKVGQDIRLAGTVQADGTFSLEEFDDKGQVTGQFGGKIGTDGSVTGTWRKPGSDKTLALALREAPAGAAGAPDAVTVTGYSFSVKGPNDTEGEYSFPRVTGPAQNPALARLKAQLTVKQLTDQTEREIKETFAGCGCGLTTVNYTVDYNRNGVLALSVGREWVGAYSSFSAERLVLSTRTGERLSVGQLLLPAALPELARQADKLLQVRMQEARRAAADSGGEARWLDELLAGKTFATTHLSDFTVIKDGITFYFPFAFPNAAMALQPDDAFTFTFAQLKPYLKPDGPLGPEIK